MWAGRTEQEGQDNGGLPTGLLLCASVVNPPVQGCCSVSRLRPNRLSSFLFAVICLLFWDIWEFCGDGIQDRSAAR